MKLFSRLKAAFMNSGPFTDHINSFESGEDLPNEHRNIMKYSAVFACIRVLAETYASVTIGEFKRKDNGDKEATNDTGLLPLLKYSPNGYTSAYNFHEMSQVQINTNGNFYALKDTVGRKNKQITGLRQLLSSEVTPRIENSKIVYDVGKDTNKKTYTRDEIYHVVGFSNDGIIGLSPLEYFGQMVYIGEMYNNFTQNFYKNGTFPTGYFEHPRFLKDEAHKKLNEALKKQYTGMHKAGTPMLLEDGLKFNHIQIKPIDAQLLESKRFAIEDISRVFRVPLHMINHLEKATFNNIEELALEFVMYTMLPHFRRNEMAINTQLLRPDQVEQGYYFEFNMSSLLRGDSESMAKAFATGRQWGWLSVNDIRRMLNMNSIGPDGDIYLQPLNMVDAGEEKPKLVNQLKELIEESRDRNGN